MAWSTLSPQLAAFARRAEAERELVPAERRVLLDQLVRFVAARLAVGDVARLVFICTHNSRRSHLAQLWAQVAAFVHGVGPVATFSGGTEATAFDHRAVAATQRAGFAVEARGSGPNPVYAVRYAAAGPAMECFSKVYDQPPNPASGFCAIMTCGSADRDCPVVLGATARVALPYDDPKAYDGSERESEQYDERCRQIAREMLLAFARVGG